MSPRIITLPLSGRDRKHYIRELRMAVQQHPVVVRQAAEARAVADRLECEEWSIRQFIGGPAEPSPSIAQALNAGRDLLEVRCRRCNHGDYIALADLVLPRERPVHTLAKVLACQPCSRNGRPKQRPDLVALIEQPANDPAGPAKAARAQKG
jgi:hypothetical protein